MVSGQDCQDDYDSWGSTRGGTNAQPPIGSCHGHRHALENRLQLGRLLNKDKDGANRSGGWVLALGTVAAIAILFAPLPRPVVAQSAVEWLAPGDLGSILALALAAAGFWLFRKRVWPRGPHEYRRLRSGIILAVLQAVLLRGAVELGYRAEALSWKWWPAGAWLSMPWFLTTGFAAMLLGSRLGMLVSS